MTAKVYTIVEEIPTDHWQFIPAPELPAGLVVHEYQGPAYGCVGPDEVAITLTPGQTPFYAIPRENVEELTHLWDLDADGNPTDYARCDIDGGVIATNSGRANCVRCLNWADLEPECDDADEQEPLDEPADFLDGDRDA